MLLHHANYTTDIVDQPFETPGGQRFSKTVIVSFLNEWNNIISVRKYAHADKKELYEKISKGETIDLDHCYIHDLSLVEYRRQYNIPAGEPVELKDFSAYESFFECEREINFARARFTGKKAVFSNAAFGHSDISFRHANFDVDEVDYSSASFGWGNVDFSDVSFGKGNITFENTRFREGDVLFVTLPSVTAA
jgi:hypothetical protein